MYFLEYCESDCNCFYVLVTRVTNMDATLNRKIMDATVKLSGVRLPDGRRLYTAPYKNRTKRPSGKRTPL